MTRDEHRAHRRAGKQTRFRYDAYKTCQRAFGVMSEAWREGMLAYCRGQEIPEQIAPSDRPMWALIRLQLGSAWVSGITVREVEDANPIEDHLALL